ncbi:hypothetical protein D6C87_07553 [Aureobasidium pullulans]|uniref:Haloacid dehalogenase n=1 Tax=Aureobasidium pullulans TaxID=5580 RepID=A0AB38LIR3_AURPU|nr:hypothetical protein D6C94_10249 [Aureobasidium pullulans]THZ38821.1 hypothetical protein D6C87_07553 [Aureobasidium pullulans]
MSEENSYQQDNPIMKRNLLLCVDAFGTLFRPRSPIAEQYGSVARSMGVTISDDEVAKSFKTAFKEVSKSYPNYGKATDMGARQWWTEVITKTFQPHHPGPLPSSLTPNLINRFWSKEGYTAFPDVLSYLRNLSSQPSRLPSASPRLVVGVITNSDDRVPDVLSSLGLRVNHLRHGSKIEKEAMQEQPQTDIDFCIMSYDVGCEKPSSEIFDAATSMLESILAAEGTEFEKQDWDLLYVGDEVKKDAQGAIQAGWDAVIVDRGGEKDLAYEGDAPGVEGFIEVEGKQVVILDSFGALGSFGGYGLLKIE